MRALVALATSCLVPSLARAEPVTESYRAHTLAVDGIALSLAVAGTLMEGGGEGYRNSTSEKLLAAGIVGVSLGTPLVHALRGHGRRAVGSFAMRGGLALLGMVVATVPAQGCEDDPPAGDSSSILGPNFLCGFEYVGYGYIAGTALAIALDAAFLTDEATEEATWSPQLSVASEGVRAGVAWAW